MSEPRQKLMQDYNNQLLKQTENKPQVETDPIAFDPLWSKEAKLLAYTDQPLVKYNEKKMPTREADPEQIRRADQILDDPIAKGMLLNLADTNEKLQQIIKKYNDPEKQMPIRLANDRTGLGEAHAPYFVDASTLPGSKYHKEHGEMLPVKFSEEPSDLTTVKNLIAKQDDLFGIIINHINNNERYSKIDVDKKSDLEGFLTRMAIERPDIIREGVPALEKVTARNPELDLLLAKGPSGQAVYTGDAPRTPAANGNKAIVTGVVL